MKNQNVIKKDFSKNGNYMMGSRSVNLGLKANGDYLVFASNFEDQWNVLRTSDRNEAINHANSIVIDFKKNGYKEITK